MAYHTFVSGEVLTAANVMNDLMNQSVIVATSGTRPASPVAGMTIFETDTATYQTYTGTGWQITGSMLRRPFYLGGNSSGFLVNTATWTVVTQTLANGYNFTVSGSQVAAGIAGYYRVSANAHASNGTSGPWSVMLRKNSAGLPASGSPIAIASAPAAATTGAGVVASAIVSLAATDYVEMFVYQSSGGSANVSADVLGAQLCIDQASAT